MKPIGGIVRDTKEFNNPKGSTVGAKNLVYDKTNSVSNEKGFDLFYDNLDGKFPIGILEYPADGISIIFSVYLDQVSEIGILSTSTGYSTIVKDTTGDLLFNFDREFPIKGEIEKNSKGEYVVAWTDTNGDTSKNTPKILNLTNLPFEVNINKEIIDPNQFNLSNLFPELSIPDINLDEVLDNGGILQTGSYSFIVIYEYSDGSLTNGVIVSNPVMVVDDSRQDFRSYDGSEGGISTTKAIQLTITNLDTNFPNFRLGVIKTISNIVSSALLPSKNTQDPITITYTGTELEEDISLSDLIVDSISYTGAHTITQLNRRLYLANLESSAELDYQKYANNIQLKWVTKDIGVNSLKDSYKNETVIFYDKAFMSDEVYAIYIFFYLLDGSVSPAFHIPGRSSLNSIETDIVTDPEYVRIDNSFKNYQVLDYSQADGTMSYWENSSEKYPINDQFDSTSIGGEDLRGTPIRHHKFPSIGNLNSFGLTNNITITGVDESQIRQGDNNHVTSTNPVKPMTIEIGPNSGSIYGNWTKSGDTVGYNVLKDHTVLVELYYNSIDEFIITPILGSFPKLDNSEVDIFLRVSRQSGSFDYIFREKYTIEDDIETTFSRHFHYDHKTQIDLYVGDRIEFHYRVVNNISPSIGYNVVGNPEINSGFLRLSRISDLPNTEDSDITTPILGFEVNNIEIPSEIQNKVQGYGFAYAKRDINNSTILGQSIITPNDYANTFGPPPEFGGTGDFDNTFNIDEDTRFYSFDMLRFKPNPTPSFIQVEDKISHWNSHSYNNSLRFPMKLDNTIDTEYIPEDNIAIINNQDREEYIRSRVDLSSSITNVTSQEVLLANYKNIKQNLYEPFNNVDLISCGIVIRIEDHIESVSNIYGGDIHKGFQNSIRTLQGVVEFAPVSSTITAGTLMKEGLMCEWFPIVEAVSNTGYRHQGVNLDKERYTPKSIIYGDIDPNLTSKWEEVKNYINYNSDYSTTNGFNSITPKGLDLKDVKHPYRVHRSIVLAKEETDLKWRTFLALDYYEMPRNKGVIWNIQGYGEQNLIIHHTDSIYRTYGNEVLKTGELEVAVGSGDIFNRPPTEITKAKAGFAGTLSQFSAHMTIFGYVFIDQKRGKIYLLNNELRDISQDGMSDWFRDNLDLNNNLTLDDNPFLGRGYTMTHDEELNRLLLTKLDTPNEKSFTCSYDFSKRHWVSFHDYKANYMFKMNNKVYLLGDNQYYKSNSTLNKGIFFRPSQPVGGGGPTDYIPYETYIDVVFNDASSLQKVFYSIEWISNVVNEIGTSLFNETFTKIWLYNNYQSTAEIDLERLKNLRRTESSWKFNDFRDILTEDTRNNAINFLKPTIEHVDLDTSTIDNNQAWYRKRRFSNTYIIVRFIFNNLDNKSIYLYETLANFRPYGR